MRRLPIAGLALLLALAAAACGSGGSSGQQAAPKGLHGAVRAAVRVSGQVGSKPTVHVDPPVHVKKSTSWTVSRGNGPTVRAHHPYIADLTFLDGRTGKPAASTYDSGQQPVMLGGTQDFPIVTHAVTGLPAGSRVVVVAAAQDAYGSKGNAQLGIKPGDSVVMVADVTSAVLPGPRGKQVRPAPGAPKLQVRNGSPTGFDFAGATKPKKLQVVTLIKGSGPRVQPGELVAVNYLGSVWGQHKVFDQSYTRGEPYPFPVGMGQVIPAWDQGLRGVTVGSRVLLLCPPDVAYGKAGRGPDIPPNATLVFVVDVLGAG